jgi:hypothetical protein
MHHSLHTLLEDRKIACSKKPGHQAGLSATSSTKPAIARFAIAELARPADAMMMLVPAMPVVILRLRRVRRSKENRQREHTQNNSFGHRSFLSSASSGP